MDFLTRYLEQNTLDVLFSLNNPKIFIYIATRSTSRRISFISSQKCKTPIGESQNRDSIGKKQL